MNKGLLSKEVQDYLDLNLNTDSARIALAKSPFNGVSSAELADQIRAKKKAEKKLPLWFKTSGICFPSPLSVEQTSSEITAKYKSKLVTGSSLIDITGGFGVDSFYFSKNTESVTHCEINAGLSEIARYNAKLLGADNINFINTDGVDFVKTAAKTYGTIYVDPARRAEKGKVFMLRDCTPDITSNLETLLQKAERIIIKTAPLLDISAGLSELTNVSEVHIVSVKNECKELLWIIDKQHQGNLTIIAATLNDEDKSLTIPFSQQNVPVQFSEKISAGDYLYEPDAALLKSGAFNYIGNHYCLQKLHPQTQLYTADKVNTSFPGRIFKIREILTTTEMKKLIKPTGNVIVRNYPGKADELSKKYKIKPSTDNFYIFTKNLKAENIIIQASIVQYY